MKLTPELVRDVIRKFGYVSNSQAGDVEYALGLLVRDEAKDAMDAVNQTQDEFNDDEDDY